MTQKQKHRNFWKLPGTMWKLQKHQRQSPADSRKPGALTAEDTGFRGRLGGSQRRGRTVLPGPHSQQSAQCAEPAGAGQGRACTDTKTWRMRAVASLSSARMLTSSES